VNNRDALRAMISTSAVQQDNALTLELTISHAKPPQPGWLQEPGIRTTTHCGQWTEKGFTCIITVPEAQPVAVLLAAAFRMCTPLPTGTTVPDIAWQPAALSSTGRLAETLTHLITEPRIGDPHLRFTDIAVVDSPEDIDSGVTINVHSTDWNNVHVDPLIHRPFGRRSVSGGVTRTVSELMLPEYLDTPTIRSLKDVSVVTDGQHLSAQQRVQLQACGVVVVDSSTSSVTADLVNSISIAGRSLALRNFTAQPLIYGWPSVSILLVTHRTDFLHRIVEMLSQQTYPNLELVLLTHGYELDDHIASHLRELRFPTIHQQIPDKLNLGEALIAASSLASGELITKIDDDDYYSPEHVWDLVTARMYSGAQVTGKALDHIYLASTDKTVFRPAYAAEKYADFVAGGTILISQGDLKSVGGWRPVPKSVDRALLDRVTIHGGLIYRTHGRGYIYVRHGSQRLNTSAVADSHFETKTLSTCQGLDTTVLADYGSEL
jgi:hypothetical protein